MVATFKLEDHFTQVQGLHTRYWMAGEGPVVLLLHGLTEFIKYWHLTIPSLIPRFRVVALDYQGHGQTEKPSDRSYGLDTLSGFVVSFIDSIGIEQSHIVGQSLGGAIAATMALNEPDRVDKLVLVDSACLGKKLILLLR